MAMTIRELSTKLGFQVDTKNLSKYDKAITKVKKTLAALGAAYAIRKAYQITKDLITKTINYYDELGEAAKKLGVDALTLQKLKFAGQAAGLGIEQLGVGIKVLSRQMDAAKKGSKSAQEAFKRLGIVDIKKFTRTEDVIIAVANGLAGIKNGYERVAAISAVFGARSGADWLPMLSNVGKLAEYFAKVEKAERGITEQMVELGDAADEKLQLIQMQLDAVKRRLGVALLPKVLEIADQLERWIISPEFDEDLQAIIDGVNTLSDAIIYLGKGLRSIYRLVEKIGELWGKWFLFAANNPIARMWFSSATFGAWELFRKKFVIPDVGRAIPEREKHTFENIPRRLHEQKEKEAEENITERMIIVRGGLEWAKRLTHAAPAISPAAAAIDNSRKNYNITYQNKFEIKTEGLSPMMIEKVISDGVRSAQEKNSKQLQTSLP